MSRELDVMMSRVARLGEITEAEARRIVNDVYSDGIVSRGEAEALFRLNDSLSGADALWSARFAEAVKDFLLTREAPLGWITEEEAGWLVAQINRDGKIASRAEVDLLMGVLRHAEGAPASLSIFALRCVSEQVRFRGFASQDMVEKMRRLLYAPASDHGVWVSRAEAQILFETNDSIASARNHKSWDDLFARAIANHLLAAAHPDPQTVGEALSRERWLLDTTPDLAGFFASMAQSIGDGSWFAKVTQSEESAQKARNAAREAAMRTGAQVTAEEKSWFLRRLGWDKTISPAEKALIEFLRREAPGFTNGLAAAA